MKSLIIIPARSGSSRVKNKNMAMIKGKPLIYYSIKSSLQIESTTTIVSTNSPEIANYSVSLGAKVPFLRPEKLSNSTSTSISVIIHTLTELMKNNLEIPEVIIFKPPTNPLLSSTSIKDMLNLKRNNRNIDSVMSIQVPRVSALNHLYFSESSKRIKTQIYDINGTRLYDNERSQDQPRSYANSPACKITETDYFIKNYIEKQIDIEKCSGPTFNYKSALGYLINKLEAYDIDTNDDLEMIKMIVNSDMISREKDFFNHI
ncbi:acylneuraminate cytidylyltransferase family protein [Prochlorococcus marinus]|uniref:acylneuraminate cytidylyltransferase family protein n=1 Tax=Prochlorococcus marinus TaxID=1219 RepID=UPI0022B41F02|nr:acylneuraminate cytidylyltransferase family protein [Prochlorococcus marinus]